MRFLGIDLGWRSQPSGVCCLTWQNHHLVLTHLDRLDTPEAVLSWVETWAQTATGIAVDAPTIIPNPTGMRLCDRLSHSYFGEYDAGCYPANLGSPFAQRTVGFAQDLLAMGFEFADRIVPRCGGRWQIEVFPHPAIVHLFALPKILKYKKGRVRERASALAQLQDLIVRVLPQLEPPLLWEEGGLPSRHWDKMSGKQLKVIEDQLDSLICAYVSAHWWYWGPERNLVLGDQRTGFIVVPGSTRLS